MPVTPSGTTMRSRRWLGHQPRSCCRRLPTLWPCRVSRIGWRLTTGPVVALVETARGVQAVDELCRVPGVARVALGTMDLAVELGVDPASRAAMAHARGVLTVASAAAGLPGPVDGVTTVLDDPRVLAEDLKHARDVGFTAKLCIHPRQVHAVQEVFSPSLEEI